MGNDGVLELRSLPNGYFLLPKVKKAMIRKWRNQKKIPLQKPGRKKLNRQSGSYTKTIYRKQSEQLFPNRRALSYPNLTKI